ncbi:hypothetical protein AB1462_32290, partial [Pseudomonas sp. SB113]|uniref:hypothetical protein n=1 Tax=Pseudomonas sp. SB113 TaxID=3154123 RepID=UPI00345D9787
MPRIKARFGGPFYSMAAERTVQQPKPIWQPYIHSEIWVHRLVPSLISTVNVSISVNGVAIRQLKVLFLRHFCICAKIALLQLYLTVRADIMGGKHDRFAG